MKKFSVSATNTFKACPRKFFFEQVEGWELINKPSWLSKGSAYDKLLENWDTLGYEGAVASIPELFPNAFEAVDAEYILKIYDEKFRGEPLRPVTFNNQSGSQLGFGVEVKSHPVTGDIEPFKATGYLDKLSSFEGELVVVERKTTSESIEPGSAYWAQWALNPQVRSYVWYLRESGAKAGWVVVEVIRKLSTTVNPKAFDKKCSIEEYRAKLMAHEEKKTLVARHKFFLSEDDTQNWIVDTINTVRSVRRLEEDAQAVMGREYDAMYAYPKHEKSCGDFGGCPFRDVCEGKTEIAGSGRFCKSEKWIKKNGGRG